jgi:pimeloyl-ACP methyl ester carboxylesterase
MARAILAIHGVNCTGDVWDRIARDFRKEGRRFEAPTLFPDLRTVDPPSEDIAALTLKDYLAAAQGFAEALQAETGEAPILMGHSMGGLLVQKLLSMGVGAGGILVTPAGASDCKAFSFAPLYTFWNILSGPKDALAHKTWEKGFKWGVLNCVPEGRHDELFAKAVYDGAGVWKDLAGGETDVAEINEYKVKVPVLTLGATKDRTTVAKMVRKVGKKYAPIGGSYIEYPNAGHWIVDEPSTDTMLRDIRGWLYRHGL